MNMVGVYLYVYSASYNNGELKGSLEKCFEALYSMMTCDQHVNLFSVWSKIKHT